MVRRMNPKKRELVNKAVNLLVKEIGSFDAQAAKNLREKITHKAEAPVYFMVMPQMKHLKTQVVNLPKIGKVLLKTEGETMTIYQGKKPLFHVISIGEKGFFTRQKNRYAITLKGIEVLTHELSHVSRPHFNENRVLKELEADIFTLRVLKRLGATERMKAYIESRPIRAIAEKYAIEARKRKIEEERIRALERHRRMWAVREPGAFSFIKRMFGGKEKAPEYKLRMKRTKARASKTKKYAG